jgi:hypothetical protein
MVQKSLALFTNLYTVARIASKGQGGNEYRSDIFVLRIASGFQKKKCFVQSTMVWSREEERTVEDF